MQPVEEAPAASTEPQGFEPKTLLERLQAFGYTVETVQSNQPAGTVLSTDPAHSLAESLQLTVGAEPTEAGDGVWAQQVQAQDELERNWSAVQAAASMPLADARRCVSRRIASSLALPASPPRGRSRSSCRTGGRSPPGSGTSSPAAPPWNAEAAAAPTPDPDDLYENVYGDERWREQFAGMNTAAPFGEREETRSWQK